VVVELKSPSDFGNVRKALPSGARNANRGKVDKAIVSARRLGAVTVRMASLAGRRAFHGNLGLPKVNHKVEDSRLLIDDSNRVRATRVNSRSLRSRIVHDYSGGIQKILDRRTGIARQLSEPSIATRRRIASPGLVGKKEDRGTPDSAQRLRPATVQTVRAHEIAMSSGLRSPKQLPHSWEKIRDVVRGPEAKMPVQSGRHNAIWRVARSVIGIDGTLVRPFAGVPKRSERLVINSGRARRAVAKLLGSNSHDLSVTPHESSWSSLVNRLSRLPELNLLSARDTRRYGRGKGSGRARPPSQADRLKSMHFEAGATRVLTGIARGGMSAHLRAPKAFGVSSGPIASATGGARATVSSGGAQPLVVNFSPSVVIRKGAETEDLEQRVVQAIERHSYELLRIINRELESQRRVGF
jgi:hypothetical protein